MRPPPRSPAITSLDIPWPGASTRMTVWSVLRSSAIGPQQFRVWLKPWTSTIGGPVPSRSACNHMAGHGDIPAVDDDRGWSPDTQATFCATLVDEWVRCGLLDAVVCPGSRSTPLTLALAADDR